ncbi:MAG: mevalonate kinase [bacterium]|nr:mevalonate kinase [bacterium]
MKTGMSSGVDVAFSYAPGKIILAGEHAVVYGCPAIAATLDRGVRIAITERTAKQNGPILKASGLGFSGPVKLDPNGEGPEVLRKALARIVELYGARVCNLELVADSSIPAGRGLGSSAALSVAIIRGLNRFFEETVSTIVEAELAAELEKVFHGTPSGIDHTVISQGGLIWYQKVAAKISVCKLSVNRPMHFVIGLTGAHGGTFQAVQALQLRAKRHQELYQHIFSGITKIVESMKTAIVEGKLAAVGELMNLNQGYLNALGVSTPEIENLCFIARDKGALGAKLTGAGGGGAVIALVDDDPKIILEEFTKLGYLSFTSKCETD